MMTLGILLSLLALLELVSDCRGPLDEASAGCKRMRRDCDGERKLETRKTIHFGLMLSFRNLQQRPCLTSAFDDGHYLAPAAYLAVEQVNNRSDLLKDYNIKISAFDGGCNSFVRTLVGVNELMCSCDPIVGIIGPSCEQSSRNVSQLTSRREFSMISINYGGSSESVGNHRYSFGILGSNSIYNEAVVQLMSRNNWTNSALLFSGLDNGLIKLANRSGYPFRFISSIYDTFIPLKQVKESLLRVIIILIPPNKLLPILCMAYHERMIFPHFQWIFYEALGFENEGISFTYDGIDYNCSAVEISASLNGSITLFLNAFTIDQETTHVADSGVSVQEYNRLYDLQTVKYSNMFGVSSHPSQWANGIYDAVWVLAFALNDSLAELNMNLTEFELGSRMLAESTRKHLLKLDIQGIIGRIKFDKFGYNKEGVLNIFQYDGQITAAHNKVGYYKGGIIVLQNESADFIDTSTKVKYSELTAGAAFGLLLFTALSLILVITAQIANVYYSNHPAIKASSPRLNHLIFLGCYMIIIGIVFHMLEAFREIEEMAMVWFCNLVPCLLNVGVSLVMGTISIKTWRLNRIYISSKNLRKEDIKSIKSYFLIGFVTVLVLVDILLCVALYAVDRLQPTQTKRLDIISNELVIMVKKVCISQFTIYWLIAFLSPKVVLTVASFLLAFSTRMNIREFKTNNVVILTYLLAIIFGMGMPIYMVFFFSDSLISIRVTLLIVCLNISICVCILVLFLPFIHNILKHCTTLCFS